MRRTNAIVAACFAVLAACGGGNATPPRDTAATALPVASPAKQDTKATPITKRPPPIEVRTFDEEIADADLRVAASIERAEKQTTSYLAAERVAGNILDRARLTGDYADYQLAEEWIAKSFAVNAGRGGIGPYQMRAALNFTLHRLDRIDADFERAQKGPKDNLSVSSHRLFAGNLALQRGQYEDATRLIEESIAQHEGVSNLSSKAYLILGMGGFDEADALYTKALSLYHGSSREPAAWLHLQLGLADLGRGKYDEAMAHYRDAEQELSGYWLIDEHIAEIFTLTGKVEDAKTLYLDIIRRTNNPEFMDAMAGISIAEGKPDEAKTYVDRARKRYEELMAMYPEAAYGHALEHYLEFGDDPAITIGLAEKNHTLRPNAEAKILLAQAYLKGERAKDAKRVIEEALATAWRTADLHAVASAVYATLGNSASAEAQMAKAKAINAQID